MRSPAGVGYAAGSGQPSLFEGLVEDFDTPSRFADGDVGAVSDGNASGVIAPITQAFQGDQRMLSASRGPT